MDNIEIEKKEIFLYDRIKAILDEKGISLRELGEKVGMSVNGIYTGFNRKSLKVDTLLKIIQVLDIEPGQLFDEQKEKERRLVLLNRKLQESEELITFLRDKQSEFMTAYEMELLSKAKEQLNNWHYYIKNTPKKKLLSLINTHKGLSFNITNSVEILNNIIQISPEKESVKTIYENYSFETQIRFAEEEAIIAMKELKKLDL